MNMQTEFAGAFAGASPFVAVNIGALLYAAGFTATGLWELTIQNGTIVSGNLVLSSNSTIAAEADGIPISDAITIRSGGRASDVVQSRQLYLYSSTALKDFSIYARAVA